MAAIESTEFSRGRSGVNDYQTNVRPRLLDLLHFPEWFTNLVSLAIGE